MNTGHIAARRTARRTPTSVPQRRAAARSGAQRRAAARSDGQRRAATSSDEQRRAAARSKSCCYQTIEDSLL
ncbi:MAG: hypothetical protein LBD25_01970 [Coriobacteriales bacterium]|nr:hypothetical protein [Coriobacteriales bacterium]